MNDDISKIVDGILERIAAADLIVTELFRGCSEAELDGLARNLDLPLPRAYRRVLERCGHFEGYTFLAPANSMWRSTYFEVLRLHSMVQDPAYVGGTSRIVPDDWLVFRCLNHPTYRFHCLDAKLGDDPPVFEVTHTRRNRHRPPVQIAERFTDYLSDWVDQGIEQRKAQLALNSVTTATTPTAEFTGPHARVFELLASIKQRPAMWIPNLQISLLETFLAGFERGLATQDQYDRQSSFSGQFSAFVYEQRGWSVSSGWAAAIREAAPTDERAREVFFELVDEFRDSRQA